MSCAKLDGHVDLPVALRFLYGNRLYEDNFTQPFEHGGLFGHVDLQRLRQGQAGGAFWSVFAPCPDNLTDFSDENYAACMLLHHFFSYQAVSVNDE